MGVIAPKIQLSAQEESSIPYLAILIVGNDPSEPRALVMPLGPISCA